MATFRIYGNSGRNILEGSAGSDTLCGYGGNDQLDGGSAIDANTTNGSGDNSFDFIGTNTAFTGAAGQLRTYWSADGLVIEGDVNDDRKADFAIEVVDPNHNIALTSSDFFL